MTCSSVRSERCRKHDQDDCMFITWFVLLLACFWLAVISTTVFGATDDAKAYIGLGGGSARATVDEKSAGFHTLDWEPDVGTWRLFAGYRIIDYAGIEVGYIPFGKFRVSTSGGQFFEADVAGVELTPVFSVRIVKALSLLARAGIVFWHSDIEYQGSMHTGAETESGESLAFSLGAGYAFWRHLGIRVEYSLYDIEKSEAGAGDHRTILASGMFAF